MKAQGNKLQDIFKKVEKEIKSRGGSLTKDKFFNDVAELLPEGKVDELIIKYSPFEYLNNQRMKEDPSYLEKAMALYENEAGVKV